MITITWHKNSMDAYVAHGLGVSTMHIYGKNM